jgi:hypothetical protein
LPYSSCVLRDLFHCLFPQRLLIAAVTRLAYRTGLQLMLLRVCMLPGDMRPVPHEALSLVTWRRMLNGFYAYVTCNFISCSLSYVHALNTAFLVCVADVNSRNVDLTHHSKSMLLLLLWCCLLSRT